MRKELKKKGDEEGENACLRDINYCEYRDCTINNFIGYKSETTRCLRLGKPVHNSLTDLITERNIKVINNHAIQTSIMIT